ncbi:GntR family transcriptional regulator [Paludisphaera borealis]|uniref:HTH-type transcriptional repressor RspR n=1 Tax=Paludisphaera borealis TaxID=1387353 RepID=A0A1U7CSQ6_9BACT|nr:GntR family transcriptional regulator [Paludisphaera borealis]APW61929.1 HTH-type transcriptional repressor RspR [Paludisphaera borealis]
MLRSTTTGSSTTWDHGRRRQVLVESLLREIVNGSIRPGEHLVTQALARRFGVSHTPVREALIMLAGMGLVDAAPNRGSIVRRVTTREVREICQVRRALECEAVRLACGRIPTSDLVALREALLALIGVEEDHWVGGVTEARALDSRLHDLIASGSGNSFLVNELGRFSILFRTFRDVAWSHSESRNDYHRLDAEAREHLAVVEALLAGDRQAAVAAMARHIAAGVDYWSRALPEGASPPAEFEEELR